jgi:uncharacterized membrane protein YhaH (DUF805 family)
VIKKNNTIVAKIGLPLAVVHLIAFVTFALYVRRLHDPQAPLLLIVFLVIDFPVSLLDLLLASFHLHVSAGGQSWFAELLYPPYLIHGVLGTVWWYFVPRFLTPRRLGGVW